MNNSYRFVVAKIIKRLLVIVALNLWLIASLSLPVLAQSTDLAQLMTSSANAPMEENPLLSSVNAADQIPHDELEKLQTVFAAIKHNYPDEINDAQLMINAIRGMVTSLDAYSDYLTPQAYQRSKETIQGQNANAGLVIEPQGDQLIVLSTLDDSSARQAGIRAGDVLLSVNGEPALAEQIDNVRAAFIGEPNTYVEVAYVDGLGDTQRAMLERQIIELDSHQIRRVGSVSTIRIGAFNETTVERLRQEIMSEKSAGALGFIIDLRNNPGGLVRQAIDMAELFLDGGIIVSTQGKQPAMQRQFAANPGDIIDGLPLIVLVNRGTASAAEIVAGALQTGQRAMIVGQTTFGKASIQSVVDVGESASPNGLKLTIGYYYLPDGDAIEGVGIQPNVELEQQPLDADDLLATLSLGSELENVDTSALTETELNSLQQRQLSYLQKTDPNMAESVQLMQALMFANSPSSTN